MHKASGKFHQRQRQRGVQLQSGLHTQGKGSKPKSYGKPKSRQTLNLERIAMSAQLANWIDFIERNVEGDDYPSYIPEEVIEEHRRFKKAQESK